MTPTQPTTARPRARSAAATRQPEPAQIALLGELDIHLFREGTHARLYRQLGCHLTQKAARFAVWAPNAQAVSVIGDFNNWRAGAHPAQPRSDGSGIWEVEIAGVVQGQKYKYAIQTQGGDRLEKADPYARYAELPPATASIVWGGPEFVWGDDSWMQQRAGRNALDAPMSVYEMHLGSWRRNEDNTMLGYRALAPLLAAYLTRMNFTHVELMPVTEHPFYGSWGYCDDQSLSVSRACAPTHGA